MSVAGREEGEGEEVISADGVAVRVAEAESEAESEVTETSAVLLEVMEAVEVEGEIGFASAVL